MEIWNPNYRHFAVLRWLRISLLLKKEPAIWPTTAILGTYCPVLRVWMLYVITKEWIHIFLKTEHANSMNEMHMYYLSFLSCNWYLINEFLSGICTKYNLSRKIVEVFHMASLVITFIIWKDVEYIHIYPENSFMM